MAAEREDDLICPVCQDVFFRPVVTSCGHHFCKPCLELWLQHDAESETGCGTCPLCRDFFIERIPYYPDEDLERRAIARVGQRAYRGREIDVVEAKLAPKVEAYRQRRQRVTRASGVVAAGLGAAAIAGSISVGVGAAAFLSGLKVAAWLDDQGRYCVLEDREARSQSDKSSAAKPMRLLNMLESPVVARIYAAKRERREVSTLSWSIHKVAVATGLNLEEEALEKAPWELHRVGETLLEFNVGPGSERKLKMPATVPKRFLLTVSLPGMLYETELGSCAARRGRRFVIAEVAKLGGLAGVSKKGSIVSGATVETVPSPVRPVRDQHRESSSRATGTESRSSTAGKLKTPSPSSKRPSSKTPSPSPQCPPPLPPVASSRTCAVLSDDEDDAEEDDQEGDKEDEQMADSDDGESEKSPGHDFQPRPRVSSDGAKRSSSEVCEAVVRWRAQVQGRAAEVFGCSSEADSEEGLKVILEQLANGTNSTDDVAVGKTSRCIYWHGQIDASGAAIIQVPYQVPVEDTPEHVSTADSAKDDGKASRWEIQLDDAWVPCDDSFSAQLKSAEAAGGTTFRYRARGQPYRVDLERMEQVNTATGKSRPLRRTLVACTSGRTRKLRAAPRVPIAQEGAPSMELKYKDMHATRALAILFADDEVYDLLQALSQEAPFKMTCSGKNAAERRPCVHLGHVALPF